MFRLLALFLCLLLLAAAPAQAARWQLTGQSAEGLAQQYVDLDSVQGTGSLWTVKSYFVEQKRDRDGTLVEHRADYVTQYDCAHDRYKDIAPDGTEAEVWGDARTDPFNRATMNYVCTALAPNLAGQ